MSTESLILDAATDAVELRHRLHRIPELGFAELKTADAIRAELTRLGIDPIAGVENAPTATVAVVGDLAKPCVALRADIDCLPITESTGVDYASTHPGRMHACGHDGHTAMLLATVAVVKQISADLPVCVKVIFQPAEEGGGGGERLVKAGVLDGRVGPKVAAIFGIHGWPGLSVGVVGTRPGELLASTDAFRATFVGRGCHGAFPHLGRDPIVTAAGAVMNLQQIASREWDPTDPVVVTVGIFQAGTATNVIPDTARIEGTVRTLREPQRKVAAAMVERRLRAIAAAGECALHFEWVPGYPATVNDPAAAAFVAEIAKHVVGAEHFYPVPRPSMGGEDFAYYLQKVPGCFFLIGLDTPGGAKSAPLHSDRFNFNDEALPVGVRMFIELLQHFRPGDWGSFVPAV